MRSSARIRGYDSRWEQARADFLKRHPLCVACKREGKRTGAVHVDHIKPHRGDMAIFWDRRNWQPLCAEHHNRDKQQVETRGYSSRIGADGLPLDPNHPFNRTR